MIQIWQVPSECGPSDLVVLGLTLFLPVSESFFYETVALLLKRFFQNLLVNFVPKFCSKDSP